MVLLPKSVFRSSLHLWCIPREKAKILSSQFGVVMSDVSVETMIPVKKLETRKKTRFFIQSKM